MDEETPLDAEELMALSDRIERLAPDDAEWVGRLFQECLRARLHEAELMAGAACSGPTPEAPANAPDYAGELAQVALDTAEWLRTLWNVGYMGAGSFPSAPRTAFPQVELEDVLKSALFARIREGKRPLPFPPPTRNGLPWHDLIESDTECHLVAAELVCDADDRPLTAIIESCPDWQVVEQASEGADGEEAFVVQHRGKGPRFRLKLDGALSSLCREPPRWTRNIRHQERGGFRHFTLEWPHDGGLKAVPLRAATWERAEAEAAHWIAAQHPEMYGQVSFERCE